MNVVPSASGSARLRMGKTDVMAVVKAEVVPTEPESPHQGIFRLQVECSSSMLGTLSNSIKDKRDLETSAQLLAKHLEDVYSRALRKEKLCIVPGKRCWMLSVDCVVFSTDGSLLDALSVCTRAALRVTLIPAVTVVRTAPPALDIPSSTTAASHSDIKDLDIGSEWRSRRESGTIHSTSSASGNSSGNISDGSSGSNTMNNTIGNVSGDAWEVLVDENPINAKALARWDKLFPVVFSVSKIGSALVIDTTQEEEACASARVAVAVDATGKVVGVSKTGQGALAPESLAAAIGVAVGSHRDASVTFETKLAEALGKDAGMENGADINNEGMGDAG